MEKMKIYYSKQSDSMDIWFGNPDDEYICEEAGDGFILKKNKNNEVIGIEKLYISKSIENVGASPVEVIIT